MSDAEDTAKWLGAMRELPVPDAPVPPKLEPLRIGVKLVGGKMPTKAHPDDAGWDVYSTAAGYLRAGARNAFTTGIQLDIPRGWFVEVRPRSGLARHSGVTVLNAPATIDAGYQGEIRIILVNLGDEAIWIKPGDRIAQLIPVKLADVVFEEVAELSGPTDRGSAGWGSSGK